MINSKSRIYIAGHKGLVGSSILRLLKKKKFQKILTADRKKLDLRVNKKVETFFKKQRPEFLIICAAKVGGIMANYTYPTEFITDNLAIQNNLLTLAKKYNVKRTIFLGSSCIYPKKSKTPIKEEYLLSGKLEQTNEAYAISKIAGIKLSQSLFKQYKQDIVCLMPTNVYGINDNFDLKNSHVIPGMIAKFLIAHKKKKNVKLWGTGKPIREFIFDDDLAKAILIILSQKKEKLIKICDGQFPIFNVGSGYSLSIKQLANKIKMIINFKGKIYFDPSKPDGTYKKNLNSSKIRKFSWKPLVNIDEGLKKVISHYKK